MRIIHYKLLPYLSDALLIKQYDDCCRIAKNMHERVVPGHVFVNRILDYDDAELNAYAVRVMNVMKLRAINVDLDLFWKWRSDESIVFNESIFQKWHNDRYLKQCVTYLQELYDCGSITLEEWSIIQKGYEDITGERFE